MRRRSDRAFTLIEVMVALTLGSALVLAIHQVFGASSDLARQLAARRIEHDRQMEARALLTRAFAGLDLTSTASAGFRGDPGGVRFASRTPGGSTASLRIGLTDGWLVLAAGAEPETRLLPAARIAFEYLPAVGADSAWVRGWQSPASAPVAVRLRLLAAEGAPVDTFLFAIGPRG